MIFFNNNGYQPKLNINDNIRMSNPPKGGSCIESDMVSKDKVIRQINMLNPNDHEQAIVNRIIELIKEM